MSLYDEMQDVAKSVLGEFKQGTVKLIKVTPGTGAADDPGAPTEVSHTLSASVKGVSYKYIRDGFATVTDREVIASIVDDITPDKSDFIEIDGDRHKILLFEKIPAAGTTVAWKFLVRK